MKQHLQNAFIKAKQFGAKSLAVSAGVLVTAHAHATSALDTASKASLTTGLGDLKDTLLDVVTVGIPFVIGGAVILAVPSIVKAMVKKAAS